MKLCPACRRPLEGPGWDCAACGHRPPASDGVLLLAPQLVGSSAAFPIESFARLAAREEGNYWFRARNRLIVWALRRHFPRLRDYLEVGCGTGGVLAAVEDAFPTAATVGSEAQLAGLAHTARRARRSRLLQMDGGSIPFRDEFDAVGCFDVLEHIEDDRRVLEQCFLAVRPGGGIIVTVPQHPFLWSASDEYARHLRRYTRARLLARLREAHFHPVLATSFVTLLFPVLLAARARRRRLDEAFDPEAEFAVGAAANALLEGVLGVERQLIRLGARFPFGGSLLVVARKPDVDSVQ